MTQMYKSEIVRGRDCEVRSLKERLQPGGGGGEREEERGLSECLAPR